MDILRYTLLRLGLIAGAAVVLYLVGTRGALLWALAIIVGFLLAFLFFRGSGDAAAAQIARLTSRQKEEAPTADDRHEDELPAG